MDFSEVKALGTHLTKILNSGGKDENMLLDVMGEWSKFKVTGQKLSLLNLLDKIVSMSDRSPLLNKLLSTLVVLSTSPCEKGINVMNTMKNKSRLILQTSSMNDIMMINNDGRSINILMHRDE
jgi:hypothetical protein